MDRVALPAGNVSGKVKVACCFSLSRETVAGCCLPTAPSYPVTYLKADLGGVEGDVIGGLGKGHVDGLDAGEGRGLEVGREGERVVLGANGLGKALGVC